MIRQHWEKGAPEERERLTPQREPGSRAKSEDEELERLTSAAKAAKSAINFQMPTGLADGLGVESLPRPNGSISPCRQREHAVGAAGTSQAYGSSPMSTS